MNIQVLDAGRDVSGGYKVDVTRGERVCSFFWAQSMIRDDARRALLFEMDQSITRLRTQLGETPETVGLTGNYHNLLRMWAET